MSGSGRERSGDAPEQPDRQVRPEPGSSLNPFRDPPSIGGVPIGHQPPKPPDRCPVCIPGAARMPGINDCPPARPLGVDGKPIDPEDLPHAEPAQPDNRAKISDLYNLAAGTVHGQLGGIVPVPADTDSGAFKAGDKFLGNVPLTPAGVGKNVVKGGVKALGKEATEKAEKKAVGDVVEREAGEVVPTRAPDARPEDAVAPSAGGTRPAVGKSEPMRRPDGPVDPTKPPPHRIDPWKDTMATRPDVGETRRRGEDLYDRRTKGLKNSPEVEELKTTMDLFRKIFDTVEKAG